MLDRTEIKHKPAPQLEDFVAERKAALRKLQVSLRQVLVSRGCHAPARRPRTSGSRGKPSLRSLFTAGRHACARTARPCRPGASFLQLRGAADEPLFASSLQTCSLGVLRDLRAAGRGPASLSFRSPEKVSSLRARAQDAPHGGAAGGGGWRDPGRGECGLRPEAGAAQLGWGALERVFSNLLPPHPIFYRAARS